MPGSDTSPPGIFSPRSAGSGLVSSRRPG